MPLSTNFASWASAVSCKSASASRWDVARGSCAARHRSAAMAVVVKDATYIFMHTFSRKRQEQLKTHAFLRKLGLKASMWHAVAHSGVHVKLALRGRGAAGCLLTCWHTAGHSSSFKESIWLLLTAFGLLFDFCCAACVEAAGWAAVLLVCAGVQVSAVEAAAAEHMRCLVRSECCWMIAFFLLVSDASSNPVSPARTLSARYLSSCRDRD